LVQRIDADPDIERLAPAPFSSVRFRFRPHDLKAQSHDAHQSQVADDYLDRLNQAVLEAVNASREALLSHTKINGRYAIRLAIGNILSGGEVMSHNTDSYPTSRLAPRCADSQTALRCEVFAVCHPFGLGQIYEKTSTRSKILNPDVRQLDLAG